MTYKNWFFEWSKNYIKPSTKERTFVLYSKIAVLHIFPTLGEHKLEELTPIVLQKFITKLTINGNKRSGKGLSPNYIKIILSIVENSLKTAHLIGILQEYTPNLIKCPKVVERKVDCFTLIEQKKIESAISHTKKSKYFGIILCLYTGLRIGELLALTWDDIDFQMGTLSITKTCRDGNKNNKHIRIIDTPKTESSKRKIPLSKIILQKLTSLKQKSQCDFIIADGNKPVFVRSFQRTFKLFLKKLNVPHKGFHSLRHTFATRALECGMDVKTLSELLGHKNATITLNRYAHSLWEHKSQMMNKLSQLL